jgi:hypothetical protein
MNVHILYVFINKTLNLFDFFMLILLLFFLGYCCYGLYKKINTDNFLTKLSNYFIPQNNFNIHIILSQYPQKFASIYYMNITLFLEYYPISNINNIQIQKY